MSKNTKIITFVIGAFLNILISLTILFFGIEKFFRALDSIRYFNYWDQGGYYGYGSGEPMVLFLSWLAIPLFMILNSILCVVLAGMSAKKNKYLLFLLLANIPTFFFIFISFTTQSYYYAEPVLLALGVWLTSAILLLLNYLLPKKSTL